MAMATLATDLRLKDGAAGTWSFATAAVASFFDHHGSKDSPAFTKELFAGFPTIYEVGQTRQRGEVTGTNRKAEQESRPVTCPLLEAPQRASAWASVARSCLWDVAPAGPVSRAGFCSRGAHGQAPAHDRSEGRGHP